VKRPPTLPRELWRISRSSALQNEGGGNPPCCNFRPGLIDAFSRPAEASCKGGSGPKEGLRQIVVYPVRGKQNLAYYSPERKKSHRKMGFFCEGGEPSFAYYSPGHMDFPHRKVGLSFSMPWRLAVVLYPKSYIFIAIQYFLVFSK